MRPLWHIVDESNGKVLEVCVTPRQAQRAQRRWYKLRLWHGGPDTIIRLVSVPWGAK